MSDRENLVVASKVKAYIRDKGDLKCSGAVFDALSDKIRDMCDAAIESARADKRKTVQEKDFA
jgi:histone H3/H4